MLKQFKCTLTADPAPPNFLFIHCSFPVLLIGTIAMQSIEQEGKLKQASLAWNMVYNELNEMQTAVSNIFKLSIIEARYIQVCNNEAAHSKKL